jgi:cholesterol oxidase
MAVLSSPVTNLRDHYDVVVVGSGYGGAIAASRLARARRQGGEKVHVCVLERGREFQSGDYPDTAAKGVAQMQFDLPRAQLGSRSGLYNFRNNATST